MVTIWQHCKRVLGIFSLRVRKNGYFGAFGNNSDPPFAPATSKSCHKTDVFPLPSDVYGIYSMFFCYYVAWPCDLDLRPFDLQSVLCTLLLMSDPPTNIIILRLSVTDLRWMNIWSHFRYLKHSLRMRRVTWPITVGKNSPHFWNPWPQFTYSFVTFRELRRRLSHVIGENSVYPIVNAT